MGEINCVVTIAIVCHALFAQDQKLPVSFLPLVNKALPSKYNIGTTSFRVQQNTIILNRGTIAEVVDTTRQVGICPKALWANRSLYLSIQDTYTRMIFTPNPRAFIAAMFSSLSHPLTHWAPPMAAQALTAFGCHNVITYQCLLE